jgi:uncharacterized membrane protein YdjX (TVP38/TMEM64 family)
LAVLLLVAVAFALLFVLLRERLTLGNLVKNEAWLRDVHGRHAALTYAAAFVLYVVVTALSLPVATVLTLAYGWFFGFWQTVVLVSFASTLGATLAFLLSRYLFRGYMEKKFGDRLEKFDEALRRDGAFYLFTVRLIPGIPFFVINVVMGLTPIRVWTFWWVSQVGMLAGTMVYVYAGASVPSAAELQRQGLSGILSPQLIGALVLLGVFPLAVRKAMQSFTRVPPSSSD